MIMNIYISFDEDVYERWRSKNEKRTALTDSAMLAAHMTTANLRLQNAATVSLLSTSESFAVELSTPMSYSLLRREFCIFERKGSDGGSRASL